MSAEPAVPPDPDDWMPPTPAEPKIQSRWRHVKRGTTYVVVGFTLLMCAEDSLDGIILVCYLSADPKPGQLPFSRPVEEFLDGRFEQLS